MNQTSMMVLGVVKIKDPTTNATQLVKAKGFDILGFFFPPIALALSGQYFKAVLAIITCPLWIFWSFYAAFTVKEARLQNYMRKGWVIDEGTDSQPQTHARAA